MDLSIHHHALIRGLLAGAVVLASASACSRSDRTETGSGNTGATTVDTASTDAQNTAVTPQPGDTTSLAADTASVAAPTATPRAETGSNRDTAAAGYRGMERDTSAEMAAPSDTARATTDSALAPDDQSSVTPSDSASMEVATPTAADTAVSTTAEVSVADSSAGYSEMARDTSTMPEQADTAMAAGEADVAIQANVDTSGSVDTAAVSVDTASVSYDAAVQVGDSAQVDDSAQVAGNGERLDPVVASAAENDTLTQAEETPVRPTEDSTEVEDRETVAAAEATTETDEPTDEVGAAAIGGNVNGAEAVALMTRQGAQCIVVDPESAEGVALDMSETPATLNPCGLGSMVPSRISTQKE